MIIGAQKAGTTTLYSQLASHPCVLPALRKEAHYFDRRPRPLNWYRAFFPHKHAVEARERAVGRAVTGEATPFYLLHPGAPARLRAVLPDARLVVLLREPVERAISGYHHSVRMGEETRPIQVALDPANVEVLPHDDAWYDDRNGPARLGHLLRGQYAEQLERWFSVTPRDQLLVLETEELASGDALNKTLDFLDLPQVGVGGPIERNVGIYDAPDEYVVDRLRSYFTPHNERLFTLLGRRFDWLSP